MIKTTGPFYPKHRLMSRHSLAEILLMVLAVCGALAILSLVGAGLLHPAAQHAASNRVFAVSSAGLRAIVFSVLVVALAAIIIAVILSFRSRG
jgi:hypothetical protein